MSKTYSLDDYRSGRILTDLAPKIKRKEPELDLVQRPYFSWVYSWAPDQQKLPGTPRLWEFDCIYAVLNDSKFGKDKDGKIERTGGKLKGQGRVSGVLDVGIDVPNDHYHGCKIEFKAPGKKKDLSDTQRRRIVLLQKAGYQVHVCDDPEVAIRLTTHHIFKAAQGCITVTQCNDYLNEEWLKRRRMGQNE